MHCRKSVMLCVCTFLLGSIAVAQDPIVIPNPSFEVMSPDTSFAELWQSEIFGDAQAEVLIDAQESFSGQRSLLIRNSSPLQAFVGASALSAEIAVMPQTTYIIRFNMKGKSARMCFLGVRFIGAGEHRVYLKEGTYDWQRIECIFTTPENCHAIRIAFHSDDITKGIWFDDLSIEQSNLQLSNLKEAEYAKDFEGAFPRSKGTIAEQLWVFDTTRIDESLAEAVSALQGIVNRENPSLYLINRTNPAYYDEVWLNYMQEKGYTGQEKRVRNLEHLMSLYRDRITGVIVYDVEELPATKNAAFMLAGLKDALPVTEELIDVLNLPVVMDLRGRWTRNVDAYRYIYENYWSQMNPHILSWAHPESQNYAARDYMVAFRIFTLWVSAFRDEKQGADPGAEEIFANEILANTPGNIPVMGWGMYGDHAGISEYTWVRLLSEYGKYVPGTEFCSNLTVHSAIHPPPDALIQKSRHEPSRIQLDPNKVYVSVNIMDSGDALWYHQFYQRKIWADPIRGIMPMSFCMNAGLSETMPLVMQWYYENATPNETFFNLIYMNTQSFGSRFREEDRKRVWMKHIQMMADYHEKCDMNGVEIYNGGWGEHTPPNPELFRLYAIESKNLDYILADLGRHNNIEPDHANYLIGDTAVFHTLTRFQVWSTTAEAERNDMENCNEYLLNEILNNTPSGRPAFVSAMAISWYYYPGWIKDLQQRLPDDYILVSPTDLARLYRESQGN